METNKLLSNIFAKVERGELVFDSLKVTFDGPLGRIESLAMVYDGFVIFKSENKALLKKYAEKLTHLQKLKHLEQTTWFDEKSGLSITIYEGMNREMIRKQLVKQ